MTNHAVQPAITRPSDQPVFDFFGSPERLLLSGAQSGGEIAVFDCTGTRGHTAPVHRHLRASETFIALDGEIVVEVGGEQHVATAGDAALLPREIPHSFVVLSNTARYLTLHTPAGFEGFVQDVTAASQPGQPGRLPARADIIALAASHGIEILGPGLELPGRTPSASRP